MREIKFRAWVTRYDEPFMLYLKPNVTWRDVENGLMVAFTEDGEDYGYAEVSSKKIDYPLMQYTNLKDKNGKEIYEGDVVCWVVDVVVDSEGGFNRSEPEGQIGSVEFSNGAFFINSTDFEFYSYGEQNFLWSEIEVIGNIYENPELLN